LSSTGAAAVTSRIPSLDGVRGIAATGIMLFHFSYYYAPQAGLFRSVPVFYRAYLCVDLFFLLSGFVMGHVYGQRLASDWRQHWWDFARMRFARLYPLIVLTTLVLVIAHATFKVPVESVSFTLGSLALQPLLLQVWGNGLSWNYPAWSISTEAAAYVLFVFCARPLLRERHPGLVAVACVAVLAGVSVEDHGMLHVYGGLRALLRTWAEFTLGVLLYRAHASGAPLPRGRLLLIGAACLVLGKASGWDVFVIGAFACLILYAVDAETMPARILNSRAAVALGTWSYSIYLWHVPTHYMVMGILGAAGHPVAGLSPSEARILIVATMLAVIGLSAISFRYFERPIRRLIRRRLPSGHGSVTASVPG
jgi:peptidoglycan/LPS O-acetylase OafA/YrhL